MPSYWLKLVGMGKSGKPIQDDWRNYKKGLLERVVMFPKNPKEASAGDGIVLYAAGYPRVIFAAGKLKSYPYAAGEGGPDYPVLVDVEWDEDATLPFVRYGVPLSEIGVDGKRLIRRSHIALTEDEFRAAVRALRRAKARLE